MSEASTSQATVDSAVADAAQLPTPDPSLARAVLGGALAAAIALVGFLPPLVHFVTGPFGPLIGAFLVAQRLKPDGRGCIAMALTVGAVFAAIGAGAAAAVANLSGPSGPPDWFPATESLALILAGVAAYAAVLAGIGATIGSRRSRADNAADAGAHDGAGVTP